MSTADIIPFASPRKIMSEQPTAYETETVKGVTDAPKTSGQRQDERKGAQVENGFFRIAFELSEAFARINLSPRESRILWVLLRKTYGWDKKQDRISGSQLASATGMQPTHCSTSLNSLIARKIVFRNGGKFSEIGINTRFWQWKDTKRGYGENLPSSSKFSGELTVEQEEELTAEQYTQHITTDISLAKAKDMSADADDNGKNSAKNKKSSVRRKSVLPNCPQEEILDIWERHFPAKVPRTWGDDRRRRLAARWKAGFVTTVRFGSRKGEKLYIDRESGLAWWDKFFGYCAKKPLLVEESWFDLEWVTGPKNFAKVIDGKYEKDWRKG